MIEFTLTDIQHLLPLLAVAGGILLSLVIEMYVKKSTYILPWFSAIIFLFAAYYSLLFVDKQGVHLNNMIASGGQVNIFYFIFNFGAALVALLAHSYLKKTETRYGEFYILLQSAVLGMMMLASAKDLIMIFVGLEQMSVCFYIMAAFNRKRGRSIEAGLKYFLLGAFATGFIVYGTALIYGAAESLSLDVITSQFFVLSENIIFVAGLLLFLIGFSFKIAAFPFHMWVPDVYEGSPTPVTALMSTTGKTAAFAAIILVLGPVLTGVSENFLAPYLIVISILSMFYGSIVGLQQSNLKRMLAYSSIAHAGYMLIGLSAGTAEGVTGVIFYLAAYTFMNIGAFGIISYIEVENEKQLTLDEYSGLGYSNPFLAGLLALFMFALAGIPPFAGFFGKYYVFVAAIEANLTWLAVLGVISTVISVYFYLRVVVYMYFNKAEEQQKIYHSNTAMLSVVITVLLVIIIGIAPGSIVELIASFVK